MRIKEVSQEYEEEYRFGTNRQKGQNRQNDVRI